MNSTITIKRSEWKHEVHAYECYTCDQRGTAPRGNAQCTGCINRPTRPHWKPHPDFARAAYPAPSRDAQPLTHEASRYCHGDDAWSDWQPCTAAQADDYRTRDDFKIRLRKG